MKSKSLAATLVCLCALALPLLVHSGAASAKEFILTSVKPNTLVLVDAAARKVERSYALPATVRRWASSPPPTARSPMW